MGRQTKLKAETSSNAEHLLEELSQLTQQPTDSPRIVLMHGEVNESTIAQVIAHLLHLSSLSVKPISLVISTYGGSVDEMFSLYDTIKFLPCPVHTVALGKVMSAGVLLLAAGQKDHRFIGRSTRIMLHPMSGRCIGNIFEIENEMKELNRLQALMVDHLSTETGMSKRTIRKVMKKGHDHYLTPQKAIKLGIVDRFVGE